MILSSHSLLVCSSLPLPSCRATTISFRRSFISRSFSIMGAGQPSYSTVGVSQWYLEGRSLYGKAGYDSASKLFDPNDLRDMSDKIAVVTGANSGIGFATAHSLALLNAEVHLVCRNAARCEAAKQSLIDQTGKTNIHCHTCDTSLMSSVRMFASSFLTQHPRLDVLVNNAGGMPLERTLTAEGNEQIMATMLGGALLLTDLLLPALTQSAAGGRVINVSSGGAYTVKGITDDLNCEQIKKYDGTFFYALAKRNQIVLTEEWARRLEEKGINVCVHSMHPGWAATEGLETAMKDFYDSNLQTLRSAAEGADTIVYLASGPGDKVTFPGGRFWFERQAVRQHMTWAGTDSSPSEREKMWTNSVNYVGGITMKD